MLVQPILLDPSEDGYKRVRLSLICKPVYANAEISMLLSIRNHANNT